MFTHADGVSSSAWQARADELRVAYQGEPGAYSESAAVQYFGENVTLVPCESFEKVFEAVERERADRAALPIENSLAGTIHKNYDLLLQHTLHIVGETDFRVRHLLLAADGVKLEDVRTVVSHPMALAQCDEFLARRGVTREAAADTAGSARALRDGEHRDRAAIAGARAAKIYALNVLAEHIEDERENYTRFLMLAREPLSPPPPPPGGLSAPAKTSIAFSLQNNAGVLFKALSVFALRDIDLAKIESRHLRMLRHVVQRDAGAHNNSNAGGEKAPERDVAASTGATAGRRGAFEMPLDAPRWEYLFYLDINATLADAKTQNALSHLAEIATFIRVLGSYRRHTGDDANDDGC